MRCSLTSILSALLFFSCTGAILGASQADSIFINRGVLNSVDSLELSISSFNSKTTFNESPFIKQYQTGDTLSLFVTNNDTINHELLVKNYDTIGFEVSPGSTYIKTLILSEKGVFPLISVSEEVNYSGLCALLIAEDVHADVHYFYWILKEYQSAWLRGYPNLSIDDSTIYQPEYFTINNHSFPDVQNDSLARIYAAVGDSIKLYIFNAGLMNHNIHFHGYHASITHSSQFPNSVGREKDSFPINRGEFLILDFKPEQAGKYPVHNHNLGATLGNNIYPNGMLVFINITE